MIDHWFQFYHRILRERFKMETLERHCEKLIRAMYLRHYGKYFDEEITLTPVDGLEQTGQRQPFKT